MPETHNTSPNGDCTETWGISAADLNSFWLNAYPILIGMLWNGEINEELFTDPTKMKSQIMHYLSKDDRLKPLNLRLPDGMEVKPLCGINYNFLLNDRGLLLPIPPKPREGNDIKAFSEIEVYRKYQYRSVGSAMIRVPGLDLNSATPFGDVGPWFLTADEVLKLFDVTGIGEAFGAEASAMRRQIQFEGAPIDMSTLMFFDLIGAQEKGVHPEQIWGLPGLHYMQIMSAFPRIVAHAWLDQSTLENETRRYGSTLPAGAMADFKRRILNRRRDDDPPHVNNLAKQIFEERLETPLHPKMELVVRENSGRNWVSNCGIELNLPAAPDLDTMFQAWADGSAGNPVFTMST